MADSRSEQVLTLKDGYVVPVPVLRELWRLEGSGLRFERVDDEVFVSPASRLSPADVQFLRAHKAMIVRLLSYEVTS